MVLLPKKQQKQKKVLRLIHVRHVAKQRQRVFLWHIITGIKERSQKNLLVQKRGEKTHHCTDEGCDKTWIETIPATGHQHTEIRDKKEATCEENGYSGDTYCKDCGQLISKGSEIKAKGHTWDNGKVTEEATCKKEGIKTYTCSICGDTKTEAIPKKDHTWDEGKVTKKQPVPKMA